MAASIWMAGSDWQARMAKKTQQARFADALQWFRDHQFEIADAPGTADRVILRKANCSAAIEKDADGAAKVFAYPGYVVGGEISKLVNRGYQQFLKTTKLEIPATADKLKALHSFVEGFKEALNLPHLYNESLGTTSEGYIYDRVQDRDLPSGERPRRPWQEPSKEPKA
jgi:hypothetical protein